MRNDDDNNNANYYYSNNDDSNDGNNNNNNNRRLVRLHVTTVIMYPAACTYTIIIYCTILLCTRTTDTIGKPCSGNNCARPDFTL